jgi:hypothetical protein
VTVVAVCGGSLARLACLQLDLVVRAELDRDLLHAEDADAGHLLGVPEPLHELERVVQAVRGVRGTSSSGRGLPGADDAVTASGWFVPVLRMNRAKSKRIGVGGIGVILCSEPDMPITFAAATNANRLHACYHKLHETHPKAGYEGCYSWPRYIRTVSFCWLILPLLLVLLNVTEKLIITRAYAEEKLDKSKFNKLKAA